jgi:GMP synthase-like glutamine amidotransferase
VTRPVAVLRFSPTEVPAYFGEWLDARRVPWTTVAIDAGAAVPAEPRAFAGIAMMGGPMSVNDPLPWIEPLCALLRDAVAADVPVLGHCLGGQLLAKALGAKVERARSPEIGWIDVATTDEAARREWFGGRAAFTTFQWHYEAFTLPVGATRVLTNAHNAEQAFVMNDRHIGLQCHVEMTRPLTETWLASSASELPRSSTTATQSAGDIGRALDARIDALHAIADDLYARWAQGLRR